MTRGNERYTGAPKAGATQSQVFNALVTVFAIVAGLASWFLVSQWLEARAAYEQAGAAVPGNATSTLANTVALASFALISGIALLLKGISLFDDLNYQQTRDPLTALPNEDRFQYLARSWIKRNRRTRSELAVIHCYAINMANITESLGHPIGDAVLAEIGRRLRQLRHGDALATRLSSDEFAVMLPMSDDAAADLIDSLQQPIRVDGLNLSVQIIAGAAQCGTDPAYFDQTLTHAQLAADEADRNNTSDVVWFDDEMATRLQERAELERELSIAMDRDELTLHYQPLIDARTAQVFAVEALLRWDHPTRGWVDPRTIIAIADHSGLIHRLGPWVLDKACRQMALWQAENSLDIRVSVNISDEQFASDNFLHTVVSALRDNQLSPESLQLEIDESVLANDADPLKYRLECLHENGIAVAVDNIGTGRLRLTDLTHLPLDCLKIDRSIIEQAGRSEHSHALLSSLQHLADSVGLYTVAEGVETEELLNVTAASGCTLIQGNVYASPKPADEIVDIVQKFGTPRPFTPRLVA